MSEKSFPDSYPITALSDNPATDAVFLWRTVDGWVERRSDGSVHSVAPVTYGQTLDLGAIKTTGSGLWLGGTLANGPQNSGSEGSGLWSYKGDATSGTMAITVFSAPDNRQAEGSWVRSRSAGNWGGWAIAPKAGEIQTTTGNRTVLTGESWLVGDGHVMSLSYLSATKTIKLKPITTWANVPQPISSGFTVPAKPTTGSETIEYRVNTGSGAWEIVAPVPDPVDARFKAIEDLNTAQTARLAALEGVNYDLETYALDQGTAFVAAEAIGFFNLVHIRTADGKIELASDTDTNKPADGVVLQTIAAGGSVKVYGSGSKLTDLGLASNVSVGKRLFLGTSGEVSLVSTGTGRLLQEIGVYRNGGFYMNFSDPGYVLT